MYFWNVSNFDTDYKIVDLPRDIQVECIDCSTKYLACGGRSPYLIIYDIEHYFTDREISRKAYKLPEGFERGITKLQFLRAFHSESSDSSRLALLMNGSFVILEIPNSETTIEEAKVDSQDTKEKSLRILMSIKLPKQSIKDFDIDRNCYYVSLLTTEGEIKIYDLEITQASDAGVTNQKLGVCFRETISYHKEFKHVTQPDFEKGVQTY